MLYGLNLLSPTCSSYGFINLARALNGKHRCQGVQGGTLPAQVVASGHSASSGCSQVLWGGGFSLRGALMTLDVPAYQLRLKDWAQQDGGSPAVSSPLRSVRHSRDSEQEQSAHNLPGEEDEAAVISTLKIAIIHFASLNPFPGHLNTSSSETTSVFTTILDYLPISMIISFLDL